MGRILRSVERASRAPEGQRWLDIPSYKLEHALAMSVNLFGDASGGIRNALDGTWLGHPLHPFLTGVPIGAWTTALVFDITAARAPVPGRTSRPREGRRRSLGIGVSEARRSRSR